MEEIIRLLELGTDINATDEELHGKTALMMALEGGHMHSAKVLLDCGADVNVQDKYGWTALMMASRWGHTECVKLLIDRGADVKTCMDGLH